MPPGKFPVRLGLEIFGIADDRVADMGGVGAELVGAAGDRLACVSQAKCLAGIVDDRIERDGVAGIVVAVAGDAHASRLRLLVLGEPGRDAALVRAARP